MPAVTGVVLAAGASERMGEPKLLLPYRGTTVLNATIAAVGASAVEKVIVVTGARAEEVEASLGILFSSSPSGGGAAGGGGGDQGSRQSPDTRHRPEEPSRSPEGSEEEGAQSQSKASTIVMRNPDYRRGNMSSLLTATSSDPEAEAFILVPGDLPTIRVDAIDSMIDLWAEERPWAAVTEYNGRIAHPFLLSRDAVEAIAETAGEKVLGRLLVDSDDDRVMRLSVPYEAPHDINTPEDYEALLRGGPVDQ